MSVFENNKVVDNSQIARLLINQDFGKYGNLWLKTFKYVPFLNDLRSRSLPFTTPWGSDTHPEFMQLPKLEYTDKSLSDILDERAETLFARAVEDDKRIWIMWSGGIDSTTLIAAFIRTIDPVALKERVSIVMSANSVAENFYFYSKFIHNQFETINWLDLDVTQELLEETIVLHGDPANALLSCPTVSAFAPLVESKRHLLPFRNNLGTIIDNLNPDTEWAEWYVHKLAAAIPETDSATSIAAFWWWNYVNFKWHGSILRPFFFTRKSVTEPITEEQFEYYYDTCFYINNDLQNWSYSNIDRIVQDPFNYKPEMRSYIHSVSGDDLYTKYKGFKASRRTNANAAQQTDIPLVYNKNWVGITQSPELLDTISELLSAYNG